MISALADNAGPGKVRRKERRRDEKKRDIHKKRETKKRKGEKKRDDERRKEKKRDEKRGEKKRKEETGCAFCVVFNWHVCLCVLWCSVSPVVNTYY